jgi:hypothetical protein
VSEQTWLVMLYQDADDKILEQDIYLDLNEAERAGSSDSVKMVAQIDRYQSGFQGDGNWTGAKRYLIQQDSNLGRIRSQEIADLGEVNMAAGETLVDFVTWAAQSYPADKHVLILSDHGLGWPGGWSDPTSTERGNSRVPLTTVLGDQLYLSELDQALGEIRSLSGIEKFELIGMDACLMGHLEVLQALESHARYAVVSQETEPALGWAYASFLQALLENPQADGEELGRWIVDSYIQGDQRVVDDQARAEFLRQGSPMGGSFASLGRITADQLAEQLERDITLTAVDLAAIPELTGRVNELAFILQDANQQVIAEARNYTRAFTNIFGRKTPAPYLDLGNLVRILKRESDSPAISQAADQVLAALKQAVLVERHGPNKKGASGISIYFPNSQLYRSPSAGPQSYTAIADRFAQASLWDEFLAYHYAGQPFEPDAAAAAVPPSGQARRAPGAEAIEVAPITLSARLAAPGQPVLLSTDVRGTNVGYIKLFAGYYDQQANSIFITDTDFLESPETRNIDGVYYPVWGQAGEFTLEFEWEPIVYAISDGDSSVVALFTPQSYGATAEEAVYSVDGIYTFAEDGEQRYARLYFQDGVLRQVYGFTGEAGEGAPRAIIPQAGDQFTILEQWLDLDPSGSVTQTATQEGQTLTFGEQMFTWRELDAAAGNYIVGFSVEDLDGNAYPVYTTVMVR